MSPTPVQPTQDPDAPVVQVDIVSDVMCPWCVVGFKQLEQALAEVGVGAYIRWHPFELNPNMPPEGQNLGEHIAEKYGLPPEQSVANRKRVSDLGADLGFAFNFDADTQVVNTFEAHQLLDWSQSKGLQHPLKLALFKAHFTDGKDVSQHDILIEIATSVGLDTDEVKEVLKSGTHAKEVRERQEFWSSRGITGVPSMVFDGKYLLTGAQGAQNYAQLLQKVLSEKETAA